MQLVAENGRMESLEDIASGYRPMCEKVIIRRVDAPGRSPGGILMPDSFERSLAEGIVLVKGPGRLKQGTSERIPINVEVGDQVIFSTAAALAIDPDHKEIGLLSEDNIICVRVK